MRRTTRRGRAAHVRLERRAARARAAGQLFPGRQCEPGLLQGELGSGLGSGSGWVRVRLGFGFGLGWGGAGVVVGVG